MNFVGESCPTVGKTEAGEFVFVDRSLSWNCCGDELRQSRMRVSLLNNVSHR